MEFVIIAVVLLVVFWLLRRGSATPRVGFVGPVQSARETEWRGLLPLARADAGRVLRHPAFLAGVVLTPLMFYAATKTESGWWTASTGIALALAPLGWLTIVATNLAALRPRRTGADELFGSLPTPQSVRTSALLASGIAPAMTAIVLAVGAVVTLAVTRGDELRGSPQWAEIAAGVLLAAGGACVGVAVARWLPRGVYGPLAVVVVILLQTRFLDATTWPWDRGEADSIRFFGFLAEPTSVGDPFLELRPSGWHLLYLTGLVVAMAAVALAREGMRRPVAGLLAAGLVVTVGAGWGQTRPLSEAREVEMVEYLIDPRAHQMCQQAKGVEYCAYPDFADDVPKWRDRVEATLALIPAVAFTDRPPLKVIQRPATIASNDDCSPVAFHTSLSRSVAERVSPSELWPADGNVHPPFVEESSACSEEDLHGFFLAVQTAAWTAGLPPAPWGLNRRCDANGQARAVVALWAGAAATPDGAETLRMIVRSAQGEGAARLAFAAWDDPPMWGVDYTVADARTALALLKVPTAGVRTVLERDWVRWTGSGTSADELAKEFGVVASFGGPTPARNLCP